MATINTTYQLRGYLSKQGYAGLDDVLRNCARLYNAGLQEWWDAYSRHVGYRHLTEQDPKTQKQKRVRKRDDSDWVYVEARDKRPDGKSVTYNGQLKEFSGIRADDEFWRSLDMNIGRGALQRLERAKNAFFRRVKAGETPGYPRWKSGRRWRTIEMAMVRASMVRDGQVKIKGLPPIRIPSKRELPSSEQLKSLRITRAGRRVTVSLGYAVERDPLPHNPVCVGIDMGVTDRMVLSTGEVVLAGGDIPAAVLDTAEIPISGTPISAITAEAVAPDVAESPCPLSLGFFSLGVAPDVAESPYHGFAPRPECRVAPDVAESPDSFAAKRRRRRPCSRASLADIARKQRRLSRCHKGSRRFREQSRILANAHSRKRMGNRNECHRITTDIVRRFGHIGVEALTIRNMTRSAAGTLEEPGTNVGAKSGLNREILAQTWVSSDSNSPTRQNGPDGSLWKLTPEIQAGLVPGAV